MKSLSALVFLMVSGFAMASDNPGNWPAAPLVPPKEPTDFPWLVVAIAIGVAWLVRRYRRR